MGFGARGETNENMRSSMGSGRRPPADLRQDRRRLFGPLLPVVGANDASVRSGVLETISVAYPQQGARKNGAGVRRNSLESWPGLQRPETPEDSTRKALESRGSRRPETKDAAAAHEGRGPRTRLGLVRGNFCACPPRGRVAPTGGTVAGRTRLPVVSPARSRNSIRGCAKNNLPKPMASGSRDVRQIRPLPPGRCWAPRSEESQKHFKMAGARNKRQGHHPPRLVEPLPQMDQSLIGSG